ncbi:MAG: TonB-dependent siderophore receptor [Opitutales bacterium]|nr:TonB-dependent siderophore receptor [Opitutales bacterium]
MKKRQTSNLVGVTAVLRIETILKMKKCNLACLAITTLFSTAFVDLHGQENKAVELDDLVVVGKYLQSDQINALKSPTPIDEVPQSLTILTSDLMSLQDITSMADIADYVPGIDAGQGEGHRDDILFRGVKSTADFFVDGVRDDVQYFRPLYNIEQVEVLKGANALFFGRGGTGGLINRVSKTALIGENSTGYTISLDELGEQYFDIDANVAIGANVAFRLNAYTEDLENHRDFYYGDNTGFNPTLKFELSEKTTVNVSYENLEHKRFIDRGIPSENGVPVKSLAGITFGDKNDNYSSLDADTIRLSIDQALDDSTKLRFNYTDNDFSKLYQNLYAKSYDSAAGTVQLEGYRDTTNRSSKIYSLDLIGEKKIGTMTHKFVFGLEDVDTSNNNDRFYMDTDNLDNNSKGEKITTNVTNPLSISPHNFTTEKYDETKADLSVSSIYFSDEIALSEQFDLVLGGRIDDFSLSVKDVYGNSGGSASKTDEEFSPRLGFVYKPQRNVSYYASYSESFIPKSGGQYADLKGSTKQKTDPDVYENTEFGVKFDLDNGVALSAALYSSDAVKPTGSVADGDFAVTKTSTKGMELQATGNVTDNWFISAGANIVNGRVPAEVAEKSYSIWNLFKLDDKLSFGLGVVHKGDTIGKGSTKLPSYTRVDASAYYKIDENMRIQLNIENVTDRLYFPYSYGSGQVTVGAPIHATLKIVGRF